MTSKKLNAVHVWKQLEDLAVPRLPLSADERAVYSHLLRHSRLEAKRQLRFSIRRVARATGLSAGITRQSVRGLIAKGALCLVERNRAGHFVEVRLPGEIPSLHPRKTAAGDAGCLPGAGNLDVLDFLQTPLLREAIHAREGGFCFYCLRRLNPQARCLDHVVPHVQMGTNSYRNLVSCCTECNSLKSNRCAEDFLRWLYREGRFTSGELTSRLRTLKRLAAGKLRPRLEGSKEGSSETTKIWSWSTKKPSAVVRDR